MKLLLSTIAATALTAMSVQAQIILENYNELTQGANLSAWSGSVANYSVTAQPVGPDGSLAAEILADYPGSYNGYAAYQWQSGSVTGATGSSAANYVVSFDLDVVGPAVLNDLQLTTQAANSWSGPFTTTGSGSIPLSPTLGWQHVSIGLNAAPWAGNSFDPQGDNIWQLQFQVNGWQLAGGGPATGEEVVMDNLEVDQVTVPEPASLALVGLGAAALLIVRRK